jgi:GntR family transcriptional regulator / MocR family aminotransferase
VNRRLERERQRHALAGGLELAAEYRYDRAAIGALQERDPEAGRLRRVSEQDTRAGAPPRLARRAILPNAAVIQEKLLAERGTAHIEQHAFADFLSRGELDRHLRRMRAHYRGRRDALVAAVTERSQKPPSSDVDAGLHVTVQLPETDNEQAIREEAHARRVELETMSEYRPAVCSNPPALLLGYAQMPEPAIRAGVQELAAAVRASRAHARRISDAPSQAKGRRAPA